MSHDDFASNDEIKEFKEEGEELASEDLVFQLKSSLIDQIRCLPEPNKVPMVRGGPSPQFFSMLESLRPPPPAHMGGCYPMSLDPKTGISRGIPPWHPSQYSPSVYNEFAQFQWHSAAAAAGMYQMNVNAFRNPYPTGLSNGSFTNFPASFVPSHPGLPGHPHHHHHHHHHHPLSHPFLHSSSNPSKHVSELAAAVTAMSPLSQSHSDSLTRRPGSSSSTSGSGSSASSSSVAAAAAAACLSSPYHHSPSNIDSKGSSVSSHHHSQLNLDHQSHHLHLHLPTPSRSNSSISGLVSPSGLTSPSSRGGGLSSANHHQSHLHHHPHHLPLSSPGSPVETKHKPLHSPNSNHLSSLGLDGSHHGNNGTMFSKNHVKKPLNAFMLFMKENRAEVVAECTLKESAAINQILGKKWHSLSREEQAKYYEKAKSERQAHMQRYPGWTAKDNYAVNQKKKKKKRDKSSDGEGGSLKKCRARFGLERQSSWCKPCRRKKKCTRFIDNNEANNESDGDNMNSVDSLGAPTPDSKSANDSESDNLNLSSAELNLSSPPGHHSDFLLSRLSGNHHHHRIPGFNLNDLNSSVKNNHNNTNHHTNGNNSNNNNNNINANHGLSIQSQPSPSSSGLASLSCPPRNSPIGPNNPLSIEQLTRPHCPPSLRPPLSSSGPCLNSDIIKNCLPSHSSSSSSSTSSTLSSSSSTTSSMGNMVNQVNDTISLPQLPTPPSTDSSTTGAPQMLTVA